MGSDTKQLKLENMNTTTEVRVTVTDLRREVEAWVNQFNYIQLEVLEKVSDNCLFEFIREEEPNYLDFIQNYGLHSEFKEATDEEAEEADMETLRDFCNKEADFDSYMDDQRDGNYPMWNTCFEFKENESEDVIKAAIDAGFGVIEGLDPFNTILFVSGCGYSFYGAHWIPMYLNLPWNEDKKELYKGVDYSGQ